MNRKRAVPSRLLRKFVRLSRRIWVRVTMFAILAALVAGAAPLVQGIVPAEFADRLGEESARPILNVLASSMLAVITFSLNVMVTAHRAASDQVTPRTHRLLLEDTTTQGVLATFLGAFVYALASLVLINAGVYTPRSVAVNFVVTVFVILLVVVAILRWIQHLSQLGSMLETARTVEHAAEEALETWIEAPFRGARPAHEAPPGLSHPVRPDLTGYITHIDVNALKRLTEREGVDLRVAALAGAFVTPGTTLALASREGQDERIRAAFSVSDARSFDQDPRFGLIVLSEIGARALSPGINDPGTAIDVIGRVTRLLLKWRAPVAEAAPKAQGRGQLYLETLEIRDMVEDAFGSMARDGATVMEVQLRLQKALSTLAREGAPDLAEAARWMAGRARAQAREGLRLPEDVKRVEAATPPGVEATAE